MPIVLSNKTTVDRFIENNIEAKKYYYPLDEHCLKSMELFDRIICLPLHIDMTFSDIDRYINLLI